MSMFLPGWCPSAPSAPAPKQIPKQPMPEAPAFGKVFGAFAKQQPPAASFQAGAPAPPPPQSLPVASMPPVAALPVPHAPPEVSEAHGSALAPAVARLTGTPGSAAEVAAAVEEAGLDSRKRPLGAVVDAAESSRVEALRRKGEQVADQRLAVARLLARREALAAQLESVREAFGQKREEDKRLRKRLQAAFEAEEGCRGRLRAKAAVRFEAWQTSQPPPPARPRPAPPAAAAAAASAGGAAGGCLARVAPPTAAAAVVAALRRPPGGAVAEPV